MAPSSVGLTSRRSSLRPADLSLQKVVETVGVVGCPRPRAGVFTPSPYDGQVSAPTSSCPSSCRTSSSPYTTASSRTETQDGNCFTPDPHSVTCERSEFLFLPTPPTSTSSAPLCPASAGLPAHVRGKGKLSSSSVLPLPHPYVWLSTRSNPYLTLIILVTRTQRTDH